MTEAYLAGHPRRHKRRPPSDAILFDRNARSFSIGILDRFGLDPAILFIGIRTSSSITPAISSWTGSASHLLACLQRQLPRDWRQRYRIRPVLLETFCETPRFRGTCYRAANWIHLGRTQGRGKLDTRHQYNQPVKNIFVKPLCPDWKAIFNR